MQIKALGLNEFLLGMGSVNLCYCHTTRHKTCNLNIDDSSVMQINALGLSELLLGIGSVNFLIAIPLVTNITISNLSLALPSKCMHLYLNE